MAAVLLAPGTHVRIKLRVGLAAALADRGGDLAPCDRRDGVGVFDARRGDDVRRSRRVAVAILCVVGRWLARAEESEH
ncbi:hypothetical protein NKG94_17315 [Micromonospora sp. M12]